MMKRISRDPAEQTPFERFYLEWPKLLEDAGGVLYGANGLSEIGSVSYTHLTLPTNREV